MSVSLDSEGHGGTRTCSENYFEVSTVDRNGLPVPLNKSNLMLTVRSGLYGHRPCLDLAGVYDGDDDSLLGDLADQRRYIFGKSRPTLDGIEIPQSAVQHVARTAGLFPPTVRFTSALVATGLNRCE